MFFIRIVTIVFFLIVSVQGYCIYNQDPSDSLYITQIGGYGGNYYS